MITQPEDYFAQGCGRCSRFATPACASQTWASGLQALRHLCLGVGLVETAKWGHPCYTHQGRNIAILGALRGEFRLTFRQRSYVIFLSSAKKAETRVARIVACRERIMMGKGALERLP